MVLSLKSKKVKKHEFFPPWLRFPLPSHPHHSRERHVHIIWHSMLLIRLKRPWLGRKLLGLINRPSIQLQFCLINWTRGSITRDLSHRFSIFRSEKSSRSIQFYTLEKLTINFWNVAARNAEFTDARIIKKGVAPFEN